MLIILLLFFLLFPSRIFAAPIVSMTDFPENVIAGDIFNVTFSISASTPGLIYHYKIVGDGNTEILTQPNTGCASSYDSCDSINIATSSANVATASAKLNMVSGSFFFKIRIAQSDKHTATFNSDIVSLVSILPTLIPTQTPTNSPIPTPTLTPTKTPTSTPTLTPTTKPTVIPTVDLNKYTPSPNASISAILEPTEIIENIIPTEEITPTPTTDIGQVLGETTHKKNILPLIFICLGGLFLLTPLIIAKIKSKPHEKNN